MSTCISRHGEFSSHEPDADYVCTLCGVVDEDALIADRNAARAEVAALRQQLDEAQADAKRFRADADRSWRLLADARTACKRLTAGLIANAGLLDVPFTNAPDLSPWSRSVKPAIDQLRATLGMRGAVRPPCCDMHNRNCEPPSELCCQQCTEAAHPDHADGSTCIAPDLSSAPSWQQIAETIAEQRAAAEADRDRLLVVYRAAEAWRDNIVRSATGSGVVTLDDVNVEAHMERKLIEAVDSYRSAADQSGTEPAPPPDIGSVSPEALRLIDAATGGGIRSQDFSVPLDDEPTGVPVDTEEAERG